MVEKNKKQRKLTLSNPALNNTNYCPLTCKHYKLREIYFIRFVKLINQYSCEICLLYNMAVRYWKLVPSIAFDKNSKHDHPQRKIIMWHKLDKLAITRLSSQIDPQETEPVNLTTQTTQAWGPKPCIQSTFLIVWKQLKEMNYLCYHTRPPIKIEV